MAKNRRRNIRAEHSVNELRSPQSETRVKNGAHNNSQSKKEIQTDPRKESQSGKALVRRNSSLVPFGKSRRENSNAEGDFRKQTASPRTPSKYGGSDFRVRRAGNVNFKNQGVSKNAQANFKTKIKSLPVNELIMNRTVEFSRNYSAGRAASRNNASSTITRESSLGGNLSQTSGHSSHGASGSSMLQNGISESKPKNEVTSTAGPSSLNRPEPRPGTSGLNRSDPRPGTSGLNRSESRPGTSGRRNISDIVINRIRGDKKFQANVKTMMARGDANVNRNLVNENMNSTVVNEDSHHAPAQGNAHHAPAQGKSHNVPVQENTHRAPVQENTHAPVQENTHHAPVQENAHHAPVQENFHHAAVQGNAHHVFMQGNVHQAAAQGNMHDPFMQGNMHQAAVQENSHHGFVQENSHPFIQGNMHQAAVQENAHHAFVQGNMHHVVVQGNAPNAFVQGNMHPGAVQGIANLAPMQGNVDCAIVHQDIPIVDQSQNIAGPSPIVCEYEDCELDYDGDEEMDWETSDQEVMIEHIKTIRKNMDTAANVPCQFALHSNNFFKRLTDNVLIVLDTNVFISCLPFIREIRDTYLPELGLPSIFIPWIVLRELDHLKVSSSEQLARSAIRAIRYINETFLSNHPRVNGQSFEDFCQMKNSACDSNDDQILSICVNLKMADGRRVILITNDKNLESKAIVSGVETYSKQRFVEFITSKSKQLGSGPNSQNLVAVKYTLYPKLKILLKIGLEMVVEHELKKAFGDDWLLIVVRKPPWNLMNVFECFLKHWRSVFTFKFEKGLYSVIEDVKRKFVSEDHVPGKGVRFSDLVDMSVNLLELVRKRVYAKVSYYPDYLKVVEHLTIALHEIELLRQVEKKLSQVQEPSPDTQTSAASVPIEVEDVPIADPPSQESHREEPPDLNTDTFREEVKALFQIIWTQVQHFWYTVSELVAQAGVAEPGVLEQIKCQFPQVVQKLQELIQYIEKIVSLEPCEIVQSAQLITDFTNFVVSLDIVDANSLNIDVLLKKMGLFCCDDESRAVLLILINDLKHFGNQIIEGIKHLGLI